MRKKNLPAHEIVDLYNYGYSTREIGKMYEASKPTIIDLLKKENVKVRNGSDAHLYGKKFSINEIIDLYNYGFSIVEIGEMQGISSSCVYMSLKKEGTKIKDKHENHRKKLPVREIVDLYNYGFKINEISKMYRISFSAIKDCLKRELVKTKNVNNLAHEIVDLHNYGFSNQEIGDMYKVCKETIGNILKKKGVEINDRKKKLPMNEIIDLYNYGYNIKEIGKMYDVSNKTLKLNLKNENIKIRNLSEAAKLRYNKWPVHEIIDLYNYGFSTHNIGNMYKTYNGTIRSILKSERIEIRGKKEGLRLEEALEEYVK